MTALLPPICRRHCDCGRCFADERAYEAHREHGRYGAPVCASPPSDPKRFIRLVGGRCYSEAQPDLSATVWLLIPQPQPVVRREHGRLVGRRVHRTP